MHKKKSLSSPISFKNSFEKSLTKAFLAKYDKLSNNELQDEIDRIQKQNTILKLTNDSIERESQEYILSRNRYSDAFSMLSKYNSFLQTETQNIHIQLNFDIEKEMDNINDLKKELMFPIEQTSVNSIEICKIQDGNKFFIERQNTIEQSLENRNQHQILKKLKQEYISLAEEYYSKEKEFNKIQSQLKDIQNQYVTLHQENTDIEEELKQYHEYDEEITKIIGEIISLQERQKLIGKTKEENASLEKQIVEEQNRLQERKTILYLDIPSAQDPWHGSSAYQSQVGSLEDLIEERDSLRQILQKREDKLNKALADFNEAISILQASNQAILQYNSGIEQPTG